MKQQITNYQVEATFSEWQAKGVCYHRMETLGPPMAHLKMFQAAVENNKISLNALVPQLLAYSTGNASIAGTYLEHPQRASARPPEGAGEQAQAAGYSPKVSINTPQVVQVGPDFILGQQTAVEQLH